VANVGPDGRFNPPALDLDSYLATVQRCRARFPDLRILSGVEFGEPHWFQEQSAALLAAAAFDRVLGSLHTLDIDGEPWIVDSLFEEYAPGSFTPHDVFRAYLTEMLQLVESPAGYAVLAHIDYPIRAWPAAAGPFNPHDFEEELRTVLRALARSGRALEVNTRVPLHPLIVRWWHEAGGAVVSFGSDAHEPSKVAHDFAEAAAMVEARGFRPGRAAHDLWVR
jgi:histidinol-phosphatase (PHP family)